jgi:hypothetical protein
MSKRPIYPEQTAPERRNPAAAPGAPGHDEWILDEAIEESFPASDPSSPSRPGSALSKRHRANK